jgi:hypothetical protein
MEIQGEFILHPAPAEILGLPTLQALARIEAEWSSEMNWQRLDFERLVGCGQLARHRQLPDVEVRLRSWLGPTPTAKGLDIAGLFLSGYWAGSQPASGDLVRFLLAELNKLPSGDPVRDTLIVALRNGHRCTNDPQAAAAVKREFERIWHGGDFDPAQKATVSALERVLEITVGNTP